MGMSNTTPIPTHLALAKRAFDIGLATMALGLTWWIIVLAWIITTVTLRRNGFFSQMRVGRNGALFRILKIRTMRDDTQIKTTVTSSSDPRITTLGRFFRRTKIDELPQLLNILAGHMSFVGPRPDVPGFADKLSGDDRLILTVRPGITGPATLKYRNEEELLNSTPNPEEYNRTVVFPDKVRINKEYVLNYTLSMDLRCILATVFNSDYR
jgi:lipopolysaccharide/colanic/teichoic acid biosynthesis glycosyltransferase